MTHDPKGVLPGRGAPNWWYIPSDTKHLSSSIVHKYREGNQKRTLERELNVPEPAVGQAW